MTLEELEEELKDKSAWMLTLEGHERDPDEAHSAPLNAVAVALLAHSGQLLAVEVSTDDAGSGVVNIRAFDEEGEPIAPRVFDAGKSIMIYTL